MMDFASDEQETAHNPIEALVALRTIAHSLPDEVRDELFDQVLPFAEGRNDAIAAVGLFPGEDDPLARFRVSFGRMSLAPAGLTAAAALARTIEQYATVQRVAVAQLRNADDNTPIRSPWLWPRFPPNTSPWRWKY